MRLKPRRITLRGSELAVFYCWLYKVNLASGGLRQVKQPSPRGALILYSLSIIKRWMLSDLCHGFTPSAELGFRFLTRPSLINQAVGNRVLRSQTSPWAEVAIPEDMPTDTTVGLVTAQW